MGAGNGGSVIMRYLEVFTVYLMYNLGADIYYLIHTVMVITLNLSLTNHAASSCMWPIETKCYMYDPWERKA